MAAVEIDAAPFNGEVDAAVDAAVDASPDALDPLCFGPGPFIVCLPALPPAPITLPAGTNIDTTISSPGKCAGDTAIVLAINGVNVCVIAGTSITTTNPIGTFGKLPLVFVATDAITINGLLDATATNGGTGGPGENPAACGDLVATHGVDGTALTGGGGGAGGSFGEVGGKGGKGGVGTIAEGMPIAMAEAPVATIRGGCPGGHGGLAGAGTANGGDGGGAVYLVARNTISIAGTLTASGGGGFGGKSRGGGAGGGSGGMIVLAAPTLNIDPTSQIVANGGGGGGGGGQTTDGGDGSNANALSTAAAGGTAEATATTGGSGGFGQTAAIGSTQATAGGGGGGGSVGVIRVLSGQTIPATNVSPPPS